MSQYSFRNSRFGTLWVEKPAYSDGIGHGLPTLELRSVYLYFVSALFLLALFTCQSAKAAVLFDAEWDDFGKYFQNNKPGAVEWLADYRPGHWHTIQEKGLDRIAAVMDPTSPKGGMVGQFIVRPGDNVGWTGERAEVSDMLGRDASGKTNHMPVLESDGHEYYGLAIKLAPNWQSPAVGRVGNGPVFGIFMQLHSPNVFYGPPPLSLAVEDKFHIDLAGGDLLEGGKLKVHKDSVPYPFSNGSLNAGHWVQFMLDVTWSYTNKGHIAVYRRDEGQNNFTKVFDMSNIPTLQTQFGTPEGPIHHYWKIGYYRSPSTVTNEIWLGPFVRGTSFDEVAKAAFGRS